MIFGIGTDIVEVDRIRKFCNKFGEKFLKRILLSAEQEYCLNYTDPAPYIAGRFAAMEKSMHMMCACIIPMLHLFCRRLIFFFGRIRGPIAASPAAAAPNPTQRLPRAPRMAMVQDSGGDAQVPLSRSPRDC